MNQAEFLCTPVKSSLLTSVTYSTDQTLQLEFRSDAVYRYFTVPPPVFHALITAQSKGPMNPTGPAKSTK
jgi:hypothetical protein